MSDIPKNSTFTSGRRLKPLSLTPFSVPSPNEDREMDGNVHESSLGSDESPQIKLTEYYPVDRYALSMDGFQIYAKNVNGDEYPLVKDGIPIYAVQCETIEDVDRVTEVPMRSVEGDFLYIHDHKGIVYPFDLTENKPLYPRDSHSNESYVTNEVVTEPNYAIDRYGKEHYAKDAQGNEIPIETTGGKIYARGQDNVQVYPKYKNGDEFLLLDVDNQTEFYARDDEGNQRYPKTANGDEFAARDRNGDEYFAKSKNGDEIYPKTANGDESYLVKDNVQFAARNALGLVFYAKRANQDEYYPIKRVDGE